MRVTGGEFRGRNLKTPTTLKVRPLPSMIREALFNILGESLVNIPVLDLFAGVGTFGIEALSRGARAATFVEKSGSMARFIRINTAHCEERREIIVLDVFSALKQIRQDYPIIFADPPFDKGLGQRLIDDLEKNSVMGVSTLFILRLSVREKVKSDLFDLSDRRCYGESVLNFFTRRSS